MIDGFAIPGTGSCGIGRARGHRPAFILLEIVIALAILILGMAVLGSQFQTSRQAAYETERTYRALLLAESKLAELDTGLIVPEELIEEEFGPIFPDYAWRLQIEPSAVPNLNFITLDILYQQRPDVQTTFDFDTATVLYTAYAMRSTPAQIDLTRDFGMDEDQADRLTEQLSGVGEFGIDPRNLDPSVFRNLELEDLIDVLGPMLQALGMSTDDVMAVLPPELRDALHAQLEEAVANEEAPDEAADEAVSVETPSEPRDGIDAEADAQLDSANDSQVRDDSGAVDDNQNRSDRRPRRRGGRRR
jgi:type II secretory pathway pseudopilin PulG